MISQIIFTIFLVITPLFGKVIDYRESVIFFPIPVLIYLLGLRQKSKHSPSTIFQIFQITLIALYAISVIFSKSIGVSYNSFFIFVTVLLILNLSLTFITNINHLLDAITISSIIYATIFFVFKIFNIPDYGTRMDDVFIQFWGHSYIADFLILSIPILIYKLNKTNNLRLLFPIFYLLTAIFFTNSRSAIIALTVGLIILKTNSKYINISKYISIGILLFSLLFIFFINNHSKTVDGSRPTYWHQALNAFIQSPIVGFGPSNFGYINRLYRTSIDSNTSYAHNSFLEYLSCNGLLFTLLIFTLIFIGLHYQFKNNNLLFSLGVISLINSLFDPSWSNPGIFAISLIIILYKHPLLTGKGNIPIIKFLPIIIFIFFILKTTFEIRRQTPNIFLDSDRITFLIENTSLEGLPKNEQNFYELFQLDPFGSTNQFTRLIYFYTIDKQLDNLEKILKYSQPYISRENATDAQMMIVAKAYYHIALNKWQNNHKSEAISNFEKATLYSFGWSPFQIELANAYGNNGNIKKAIAQLQTICAKLPQSNSDCLDYLQKHPNNFPNPGIYATAIDNISLADLDQTPPKK